MSITSPFLTRNAFAAPTCPVAPPVGEGLAPPSSAPPAPCRDPPKAPPLHPNPQAAPTPALTNSRRVLFLIALPLLCVTSVNSAPPRYLFSSRALFCAPSVLSV